MKKMRANNFLFKLRLLVVSTAKVLLIYLIICQSIIKVKNLFTEKPPPLPPPSNIYFVKAAAPTEKCNNNLELHRCPIEEKFMPLGDDTPTLEEIRLYLSQVNK